MRRSSSRSGPPDYFGGWQFRANTDGGVITDLMAFPGDWTVTVRVSATGAIDQWRWVNDNNMFQTLDLARPPDDPRLRFSLALPNQLHDPPLR